MDKLKTKLIKQLKKYDEYAVDKKVFIENILKITSEYNNQLENENQNLKVKYCQLEAVLESRTSQNELLQKQLKEDSMFLTNLYGKITDLSEVLGMITVIKDLIDKQYYIALENYIYDEYSNVEEKLKDIILEFHLLMSDKKK